MTSLHSLLARLKQLQADLDRDPAPFVPVERLERQKAEIESDIAVLEELIRSMNDGEPRERAA